LQLRGEVWDPARTFARDGGLQLSEGRHAGLAWVVPSRAPKQAVNQTLHIGETPGADTITMGQMRHRT